jgi:hypothetical protein
MAATTEVKKCVFCIGAARAHQCMFIVKDNSVDIFSFLGTPEGSAGF